MTRFARVATFFLVVSVVLAVMAVTVIPADKFFNQRDVESEIRDELHQIQEENKELRDQIRDSSRESSIEALARGQYNLAYPNQHVFILLP